MLRRLLIVSLLAICAALAMSARASHQILGLQLASFPGREALVIRTDGGVSVPATVSLNATAGAVSFVLKDTAVNAAAPKGLSLVRGVELSADPAGVKVRLTLSDAKLADSRRLRVSKPSERLIVVEVFADENGASAPALSAQQLSGDSKAAAAPAPAKQAKPASKVGTLPKGIQTVDLSKSDPQRVLGLAAATGLLKLTGPSYVGTQGLGEVSMKKAAFGLVNWGKATPPGELYLSGTPEQINSFLKGANAQTLSSQPTVQQVWEANRPKPAQTGRMAVGRGTPANTGNYGNYTLPPFSDAASQLSDVRINLDASGGFNLYQFLMYLSQISGISIIIDPYWFDDPNGNRPWREPLDPGLGDGNDGGPGFRPGDVFDPQLGGTGTVVGNFDNMPFDQALDLVLSTHGLVKVVYRNGNDPYAKPVVMVTSKERLEQELQGTNSVATNQFHYADPQQVHDILGNVGSLPSTTQGWYLYQGNGGGGNGGGGGQGGGGGGGQGGGGGNGGGQGGGGGGQGGGGGGGTGNFLASAKSGLLVYRGSDRQPIMDRVVNALDGGHVVVRVVLAPEQGNQYVTALTLP